MRTWIVKLSMFVISVTALPLSGCGGGGGGGGTTPTVQPPPAKSVMSLAVVGVVNDANTGIPFANVTNPVSVSIYGDDASKVVDGNGASLYNATGGFAGPLVSATGLFNIYVNPGSPIPDQINLRLVANANGFVTSSNDLIIRKADISTSGATQINATVQLIKQSAPPPTVTTVSSPPVATNNGATQSPVTVATPASSATINNAAVTLGKTEVTIPAATVVYSDAARTQPLAGNLTVSVTYNNNTTTESLNAYPGGMTVRQDLSGNALASPAAFVSGGFASIQVTDSNGTKAKTFDNPIDVSITVPKDTINPDTGLPVITGDIVPIWSYDTTTGEWSVQKLKDGTIVKGTLGAADADGNFPVTFKTDHLSYFNLDWWYWGNGAGGTCDPNITIKGAQGNRIYLIAQMTGGGFSHEWWLDANPNKPAQETNSIYSAPRFPMTVSAWINNKSDSTFLKTLPAQNLCGGVTLDITNEVNQRAPQIKYGDVPVDVFEVCDTDANKRTATPSDVAFAVANGEPVVNTVTDSNGRALLNKLKAGTIYRINVNHRDGRAQFRDYSIIEGTNTPQIFSFPVSCTTQTTTGSTGSTGSSGVGVSFKSLFR